MTSQEISKFMKKLSNMMVVSQIIWGVVIVMQFFIGIFTLIFGGYGIATLAVMGYNIYGCIRYSKTIKWVKSVDNPYDAQVVIKHFDSQLYISIAFGILNLVLGGVVGVIGCLYEVFLSIYVKKHAPELTKTPKPEYYEEAYDVVPEYEEEHKKYF